ncbi:MAG: NADP-dependent isocitrate dehydrogenase [Acidobacteriota bacterium]|nr:NADP-dependent isocitrate dehydrogenase [Acidobacteriota bacterium]
MSALVEVPAPGIQHAAEAATKTIVTVAHGDGIGPEIMQATLRVLDAAGAALEYEPIELGERIYLRGVTAGIEQEAWDSIRRNRVLLKAPITTPQGSGYKSLNVTLRKALGLYANVRPAVAYSPFVHTRHPGMNVVIIRENEEDLYGGIEHQQTDEVVQCLKLVSRPGCERIIRYAFDYARRNGRKKITCMTKDNIMKKTDGLFHKVFDEVAVEYPEIHSEHMIIDIGAARLADSPEMFDVVVTLNLYGDIISDIAAQVAGSVGLAPSANIGESAAMFEAIHGSAPQIAGQGIANPSGLLLSAVMMLVHVGKPSVAEVIHNAWLRTIEDGIHTADIYTEGVSRKKVGTQEFAAAVIERLGMEPNTLVPVRYRETVSTLVEAKLATAASRDISMTKELVGVDVFVHWKGSDAQELARNLKLAETATIPLEMITNRGAKVWPNGLPETYCTDHWRCRFHAASGEAVDPRQVFKLLEQLHERGIECVKTENLYTFDGKPAYSLGQGQ